MGGSGSVSWSVPRFFLDFCIKRSCEVDFLEVSFR